MSTNVQEAQRTLNKLDQKLISLQHTIIKRLDIQNKDRIVKGPREKDQVTYTDTPIRIMPDFSMETLKDRRA